MRWISYMPNMLVPSCSAKVFLRVKYTGSAVLHMLFSTPDISVNIELGVMSPENNFHFLVENWYSNLNGLNQLYKTRYGSIKKNSCQNRPIWLKSKFETLKKMFFKSMWFWSVLWPSFIWNNQILEYTQKCMENDKNPALPETLYFRNQSWLLLQKFETFTKPVTGLCWNFYFASFELTEQ